MDRRIIVLAILATIPLYIGFVTALPGNFSLVCGGEEDVSGRVTDRVGFCTSVGFNLQRSYYGGVLRLPVYKLGLNLHLINKYFIPIVLVSSGLVWKKGRIIRAYRNHLSR